MTACHKSGRSKIQENKRVESFVLMIEMMIIPNSPKDHSSRI
jgi:hypothetical protein